MTSAILMRNGIDVPQVVAFLMKSRTPVTRLTTRPMVTVGKPSGRPTAELPADAEQSQVEHPARADQHRQSDGVKRQHGRKGPDRGRLTQPERSPMELIIQHYWSLVRGGLAGSWSVLCPWSVLGPWFLVLWTRHHRTDHGPRMEPGKAQSSTCSSAG